jgi:hypothetical protein
MKLIKYRDWGMSTHTYFWVDEDNRTVGPYFDQQEQAETWLNSKTDSCKIVHKDTSKEN